MSNSFRTHTQQRLWGWVVAFGLALIALALTPNQASASTIIVTGTITTTTTWTTGNIYVISGGDLTINNNITLTLQPGVIVKFDTGRRMVVNGVLDIQGTTPSPTIFTSYRDDNYGGDTNGDGVGTTPAAGNWYGVRLQNSNTTFQNSIVKYATYGVEPYTSTATSIAPAIINNTFSDNTYGVRLYTDGNGNITSNIQDNVFLNNAYGIGTLNNSAFTGGAYPTITNNSFTGQTQFPIYLNGTASPTYSGNTFSNDAHPGVAVNGTLRANVTWMTVNAMAFVAIGNVTVNPGVTLTLPANTVVKFSPTFYLNTLGVLDLQGGPGAPVVFTSYKDDVYAGDTNGDLSTSQPTAGDWAYVQLNNNGTLFQNAVVKYATNGLQVVTSSLTITVPIANNVFGNNTYGLTFVTSGSGVITCPLNNNTFSNNLFPIYLNGTAYPSYSGNLFTGNLRPAIAFGGTLTASGLWPIIDSMPYVGLANLTLNPSVTLTLPANLVVKMNTALLFDAQGRLELQGTAGNPIVFTSLKDDTVSGDTNGDGATTTPSLSDWSGLRLSNNSPMQYLILKHATNGLQIYATGAALAPLISDNTFVRNTYGIQLYLNGIGDITSLIQNNIFTANTYGLNVYANPVVFGSATPVVSGNTFISNTAFPIYLNGTAYPTYTNNSFSNHLHPAVALGGAFNDSGTWTIVNAMPFVVIADVTTAAGTVVTIPTSAIIKFDTGRAVTFRGTLDLQSTPLTPTVFTSYRDDTYAGDTNGDGTATSPGVADWSMIQIITTSSSFHDSIVKYAANGLRVYATGVSLAPLVNGNIFARNTNGLQLYLDGVGDITSLIQNNIFTANTYGLNVYANPVVLGSATPVVSGNTFISNTAFPIYLNGTAYPTYTNNSFSNHLHPAVALGGAFNDSGTWTIVNAMPFVIIADVTTAAGTVVTIPTSTVIKFDTTRALTFRGTLNLQSTPLTPTIFTSYRDDTYAGDTNGDGTATSPGVADWSMLQISNTASNFQYNILKYANFGLRVYHAGPVNTNIFPTISENTFARNAYGVQLYADNNGNITSIISGNTFISNTHGLVTSANSNFIGSSLPAVTNNSFISQTSFPIYLSGTGYPSYSGNTFSNNARPAIALGNYFKASGTWEQVKLDSSPAAAVMPYVVFAATFIGPTATVSLSAGTVIKVDTGLSVQVQGELDLQGTLNNPVIFTAFRDDSVSGDTNGDGAATKPAPGNWGAISLRSSGVSYDYIFDYAVIKYATNGLEIYNAGASHIFPGVVYNTFAQNTYGLYLTTNNNGNITDGNFPALIHDNVFMSNTTAVYATRNASFIGKVAVTMQNNDLYGVRPTGNGVTNTAAASIITATQNWWGDASGPYHTTLNPGGLGVWVSNYVTFTPWLTTAARTLSLSILGRVRDINDTPQVPLPIANATLLLNTGAYTNTNANGYYNLNNLPIGVYTLTSLLTGYTFSPTTRLVSLPPDGTGQDFVATLIVGTTHRVTGRVLDRTNAPLPNVFLYTTGGSVTTTDANGYYTLTKVYSGTHTITAVLAGYTFTPATRQITVPPDATSQDFKEFVPLNNKIYLPLVRR